MCFTSEIQTLGSNIFLKELIHKVLPVQQEVLAYHLKQMTIVFLHVSSVSIATVCMPL